MIIKSKYFVLQSGVFRGTLNILEYVLHEIKEMVTIFFFELVCRKTKSNNRSEAPI